MHFLKRALVSAVVVTLAMGIWPSATMARGYMPDAMARSYSGSYLVTVTDTQNGDFTGCLSLTGSGFATLVIGSQKFTFGTYLIANHLFVATIQAQGYGQNAGLMFIAPASSMLNKGVYEEVYGGENFQSGKLAFGMKGSC